MLILSFTLNGEIVPKSRPRFSTRAYLPNNYRHWKNEAIAELTRQKELLVLAKFPIERASISITLNGKHDRGSDADNIEGSILDALVQSKVIRNDNLKVVFELTIRLNHSQDAPSAIVEILAY